MNDIKIYTSIGDAEDIEFTSSNTLNITAEIPIIICNSLFLNFLIEIFINEKLAATCTNRLENNAIVPRTPNARNGLFIKYKPKSEVKKYNRTDNTTALVGPL